MLYHQFGVAKPPPLNLSLPLSYQYLFFSSRCFLLLFKSPLYSTFPSFLISLVFLVSFHSIDLPPLPLSLETHLFFFFFLTMPNKFVKISTNRPELAIDGTIYYAGLYVNKTMHTVCHKAEFWFCGCLFMLLRAWFYIFFHIFNNTTIMKASLLCWIYCRISGGCTVVFCDFLPLGFQQINPKLPAPVKILFFSHSAAASQSETNCSCSNPISG